MAPERRKNKKWSNEDISNALEDVRAGTLSLRKAAEKYGIPASTLSDANKNKYQTHSAGRQTELTSEEENCLVWYIDYMQSINHPLTIPAVKAFAWSIVKKSGRPNRFHPTEGPGKTWYLKFKKRHNLTNRIADNIDRGRNQMSNDNVLEQHFSLLEKTIDELGLRNKPSNIFNCDETMVQMDRRTGKVVVSRRTKQAYSESKGGRDHITVNACVSASGQLIPPHIIFQEAFPSGPYGREGPHQALYSKSPSGYMDSELFYGFIEKHFVPLTSHIEGPKLLIFDGHGSHLQIETVKLCKQNNIHLYCLPPHTTHVFQPLDVVIFHPLKAKFNKLTQHLKLATLGWKNPINCCKSNFTKIFKEVWEQVTVALVKTAFRKCGIVPLDRNAIDKQRLTGKKPSSLASSTSSTKTTQSLTEQSSDSSQVEPSTLSTTDLDTQSDFSLERDDSVNNQLLSESIATALPVTETNTTTLTSTPTSSTPVNPLVASGIVPAHLYESFIIPLHNPEKKKTFRINTKARVLTSDEQIQLYEEKEKQKQMEEEKKEERKRQREAKKREKELAALEKKKKSVATRGGIRRRGGTRPKVGLRTRGGKAFRERIQEYAAGYEEESDFEVEEIEIEESVNERPKRARNLPARFEETSSDSSSDGEDWECKECGGSEGRHDEYIGCDVCDRWYHKECAYLFESVDKKWTCQKCKGL